MNGRPVGLRPFALSYLGMSNAIKERKITVVDDYDEAMKTLKEKFPFVGQEWRSASSSWTSDSPERNSS